jgi:capsular exopolysaccharide synthesis family protein
MNYSPPDKQRGGLGANRGDVSRYEEPPLEQRIIYDDPPPSPQDEQSVDFLAIIATLWRRRLVILAVLIAGLGVAIPLTMRETPLYRAIATLEVQARETQIIQGAGVDPGNVADAEFMGTQTALLKSRALAERVAETLDLVSDPGYSNPNADREVRLAQSAGAIMSGLQVNNVRGALIIQVGFVSPRPGETARIANAVAEDFIQMNLERRYNATAYARKFLEERLATTKEALETTERELVDYSKKQQILDLSSVGGSDIGSSLDASSLVSLNASLTEAQNARILAEQTYREAVNNPSVMDISENESAQALRRQRADLMSEYQQKLNIYKPQYPEMVGLQARIDLLDKEIERDRKNSVGGLQASYNAALARENALATRVSELKVQVLDLRERSIDYDILRREADTLRAQYDALLQRYKEISIVSGVGSSQLSILDRAQAPTFPFQPNIRAALIRALMLSLALAIGLAMLIEFLDDTIKTPDDVARKLNLRILGVIPKFKGRKRIAELLSDPKSPVSEAFASTRTAVHFAASASSIKSILITAGKSAEGKSSSVLALASAFAAVGHRVLIIDGDMRRPSFSYDAEQSVGLSGILADNELLHPQIVAGPAENLFLLPAGKPPPNPAELLGSTRIVHLMQEACDDFDLVIVDSPPAQPFSDALSLGAICDATIMVIQSGTVHRQTARRTVDRLRSANAEMLGCILTKFDNRKYGYGASYGYGYQNYDALSRKRVSSSASDARRQIGYFKDVGQAPTDMFD